jgi:hypothetical protein
LIRQIQNWVPIIPNIEGIFNLHVNETIQTAASNHVQVDDMWLKVTARLVGGSGTNSHVLIDRE